MTASSATIRKVETRWVPRWRNGEPALPCRISRTGKKVVSYVCSLCYISAYCDSRPFHAHIVTRFSLLPRLPIKCRLSPSICICARSLRIDLDTSTGEIMAFAPTSGFIVGTGSPGEPRHRGIAYHLFIHATVGIDIVHIERSFISYGTLRAPLQARWNAVE